MLQVPMTVSLLPNEPVFCWGLRVTRRAAAVCIITAFAPVSLLLAHGTFVCK